MTIFDHLIAGNIPASFVHQDEICVSFLDIRPIAPGHTLIVPRKSVARMEELDSKTQAHLWAVAQKIAKAQQIGLRSKSQHFLMNDGPGSNQSVPHVHLHVVPRYEGDGWRRLGLLARNVAMLRFPPKDHPALRRKLDQQARQISAALGSLVA